MSSDRTRELVLPLAILASVAVGALLGSLFARAEGGTTATAASPGDSKELVVVLQSLRAEIALLREARTALSATPSASERVEVSPNGVTPKSDLVKEMHAASEQLAAAIVSLNAAIERPGGDPDRLIVSSTPRDPQVLDSVGARTKAENDQEFLLWSPQQVVTRFGRPDLVQATEWGPYWVYNTDKYELMFRFQNGQLWQLQTQSK